LISDARAIAVKISGNQRQLKIIFAGPATQKVPGICIFATGNQSTVLLQANVNVGAIFYQGRGNQSSGVLEINSPAKVDTIAADLAGNQAALRIFGSGNYQCPAAKLKGHAPAISCK